MSQKVIITKLKLEGAAPYLGDDESGYEIFSHNPDVVINWFCDGYRTRFNQLRSTRQKHGKDGELVPLGKKDVIDITNAKARKTYSYLAAIPSMILNAPSRTENIEWFASTKRRKTLIEKHKNPGKMPGFKSRKRDDQTFVCFHNNGKKCHNAIYRKVNKNHGVVIIKGQNPSTHSLDGCRWQLKIYVKISQDIRDYTSIRVNWTQKTLVFVNMPLPVSNLTDTDSIVGIDRGCVHLATCDNGVMFDLPKKVLDKCEKEINRRQRSLARKRKASGCKTAKEYHKRGVSKNYEREKTALNKAYAKARNIKENIAQQVSTQLIRDNKYIAIEDLRVTNMLRKPKPKPNPDKPGTYLPNGRAAKRGLNRSISKSYMGRFGQILAYKCQMTDNRDLITVNPAYTSQQCSHCDYVDKHNRESQAVFVCQSCGMHMNADVNAAINIRERGIRHLQDIQSADGALSALTL